jgi:hypothetical protein
LIPVKLMLIEIVSICHSCASRSPENASKIAGFPFSRE